MGSLCLYRPVRKCWAIQNFKVICEFTQQSLNSHPNKYFRYGDEDEMKYHLGQCLIIFIHAALWPRECMLLAFHAAYYSMP